MDGFLTDLYRRPTRVSTILLNAGMDASEIDYFREQRWLNDFLLRFCPKLWEWLGSTVGTKAREVLIDSYGLYGGEGRSIPSIASKLGITSDHAKALRGWTLKQVRDVEKQAALEEMIVSTARSVLAARQKDKDRKSRWKT
jgi:hypothetical protein